MILFAVSYRGIVTSVDKSLPCVLTLDKHVRLFTGLMSVVSNIREPQPGQELTLHHCHVAKYHGVRWLVMCGASFLFNHDDDSGDIHPTEQQIRAQEDDLILDIVQNNRLPCQFRS